MKGGELLKNIFKSKEEKITEKAFTHGIFVSVLSILLCMVALVSTTYAWFTTDTSSSENVLESSRFALDISVKDVDGIPISVVESGSGIYSCTFDVVGVYTVVLTMTEDSNATKG